MNMYFFTWFFFCRNIKLLLNYIMQKEKKVEKEMEELRKEPQKTLPKKVKGHYITTKFYSLLKYKNYLKSDETVFYLCSN